MALPPQAIEKLIREPSHTQGAYGQLLMFSGGLFALLWLIYAGLAFGYRGYLVGKLEKVDADIKSFSDSVSQEDRARLQGFYSQLLNLRTLLAGHTSASPVLGLLERTLQPNVYYTKFTLNAANNQAVLAGAAKSLNDAALQAAALKGQPEVERIEFNNAGAQAAGPWQFTMTVYLKPNVLHGAIIAAPEAPPLTPGATTTPIVVPTATPTPSASPVPSATPILQ